YAAFPLEPLRVNVFAPVTVIVHVPFALVFPRTPLIVAGLPVASPCAVAVVIAIGDAFVAAVTASCATPETVPVPFAIAVVTTPVAGLVATLTRVIGADS